MQLCPTQDTRATKPLVPLKPYGANRWPFMAKPAGRPVHAECELMQHARRIIATTKEHFIDADKRRA